MITKNKIIYWLPRVLSIGFVLFLSMFALDVFGEYTGWELLMGLFMHLIPSLVLLLIIVVAWRYELVGAVVFLSGAVFYVFMAGLDKPWSWYVSISGPALVVGILFLLSWLQKRKLSGK